MNFYKSWYIFKQCSNILPGALSLGVQRQEPEGGNLSLSNAEVENAWSYTSTLPYVLMLYTGMILIY
jgi:hypothetical protein